MTNSESIVSLQGEIAQIFDTILAVERYVSMRQRAHEGDYQNKWWCPINKKEDMLLGNAEKWNADSKTLLKCDFPEDCLWEENDTAEVMLAKLAS